MAYCNTSYLVHPVNSRFSEVSWLSNVSFFLFLCAYVCVCTIKVTMMMTDARIEWGAMDFVGQLHLVRARPTLELSGAFLDKGNTHKRTRKMVDHYHIIIVINKCSHHHHHHQVTTVVITITTTPTTIMTMIRPWPDYLQWWCSFAWPVLEIFSSFSPLFSTGLINRILTIMFNLNVHTDSLQ